MELNKVEKRRKFIINIVFIALVLGLAYLFLEYALRWTMPFLLGFLVALIFRPAIRFCTEKTKLNKRFCAFVIVVIGYILVGLLQIVLTLLTFGIASVWGFIEGILILCGRRDTDSKGRMLLP